MIILADKRIPKAAKQNLQNYGKVIFMESNGICYEAISGHPDIFCCKINSGLVIAPNCPEETKKKLNDLDVFIIQGIKEVGAKYPFTSNYNALVTENYLIHNLNFTDPLILEKSTLLEKIDVKQAYTCCNTLAIKNDRFITSDRGIEKALVKKGMEVLFVNPNGILLPGFEHGFFGGCSGIYKDNIFFTGNLDHFADGEKVREFLKDYELVELYDGPFFDCGGLICIS